MATVERYQTAVLGDTINLDYYVYNNNALADLRSIQQVEIYFLDQTQINSSNPEGKRIKAIINPSNITHVATGHYRVQVYLDDNLYEIGDYNDIWRVKFNSYDKNFYAVGNQFKIYTDKRETWDRPFMYDISFSFSPKKMTFGSVQYLKIGFRPIVHTDIGYDHISQELLDKFYFNLKSTGALYIRIEMMEGCNFNSTVPDANIITDPEWSPVEIRGDNEAYYMIGSADDECLYNIGVYWVEFKAVLQGQTIISPKFYLQIYD